MAEDECFSWAGSLAGRASRLHREGREFESLPVHNVFMLLSKPPSLEGVYLKDMNWLFDK